MICPSMKVVVGEETVPIRGDQYFRIKEKLELQIVYTVGFYIVSAQIRKCTRPYDAVYSGKKR